MLAPMVDRTVAAMTRRPVDVASNTSDATIPKPYRAGRTVLDTLDAAERLIRAGARRIRHDEGELAELARLAELREVLLVEIDHSATHLLAHDASYREIGTALGITRQSAQARYPNASSRPAGGQEAGLR